MIQHHEEYYLNDIVVLFEGKHERLGKVCAINSPKVPKEKHDLIEVRTHKGDLIDINSLDKDELDLILEEISLLDVMAFNDLNEEFYHYRSY